jgi:hypothetical protein
MAAIDYKKFYRDIHAKACELDPTLPRQQTDGDMSLEDIRKSSTKEIWLTSIATEHAVTANVHNAATWIVQGTHRLAHESEIQAEKERREAATVAIRKHEDDARGRSLSPDVQALVATVSASLALANQQLATNAGQPSKSNKAAA